MQDPRSAIVDMRTAKEKCAYLPQSSTDASLETGRCAHHRPGMLLDFAFGWQHNRRATTKPPHKAVIGTKTGNRKSPEKSYNLIFLD